MYACQIPKQGIASAIPFIAPKIGVMFFVIICEILLCSLAFMGRRGRRPYIVNARFACSNFIRLGGDVRKTCSGLVERYAPSSQKISGATLIFREPYI